METSAQSLSLKSSGVTGLDTLLHGGYVTSRMYLFIGTPGSGKTTLGMHFLRAGMDAGESVLFIHGEESKDDLVLNAAQVGIDLAGAEFLDVGPESSFFRDAKSYDVVEPQDVTEDRLIEDIRSAIEERDPDRVLIDPISQLQYIEPNEYQFRKRIISFMRFLKGRGTTVVATKTPGSQMDQQLKSLSDGVVTLEHGEEGRRIAVTKHRGVGQEAGTHGFEIREGGAAVYPSLVPERHDREFEPVQFRSGIDGLDDLLGGGIERGAVTILSGPSGVGKSTMATAFLDAAAADGERGVAYLFEESLSTFTHRSETFGMPITERRESGALTVEAIEPLTLSPEEFARLVRRTVDEEDANLVVIDGIEGYRTAIKGDEGGLDLRRKLHALTRYLTNVNVSVILIDERSTVTGLPQPTSASVSYIADTIVFANYIELDGELQRIVGVLKKRVSDFETAPRRFEITGDGIDVGDPLSGVHGILDGLPERRSGGETGV